MVDVKNLTTEILFREGGEILKNLNDPVSKEPEFKEQVKEMLEVLPNIITVIIERS